ncbi:DNA/RNA helicase, superfamily II, SNF2 family protein [Nitzschia inconspicua]|uniref:DNA/RNA helicase, superfamily II, SNF2 family protein n=1 Tax=Nitzschia inconspicua TaxID=303405 RepID=A0A9K3KIU9_9STRA|nr:DNA/RNA helicase, superfamily II, SNF2 family protein [Nitzschia inconspicua]
MAPSPQGVIDLTGSDGEYDDKDQRRHHVAELQRFLSSSKKKKRTHDDDDDDHSVIVIDSDNDDEDAASVQKKPKVEHPDGDKKKPRIKQEGQKMTATAKTTSIVEDGLEVVENAGPKIVSSSPVDSNTNTDDDVVLEGVANEVRLPHLRQDCTKYPFVAQILHYGFTKNFHLSEVNVTANSKHCELCYCYVCDCPVKECQKWERHDNDCKIKNNHCCATNSISLWRQLRTDEKKVKASAAASLVTAPSATSSRTISHSDVPDGKHLPINCSRPLSNMWSHNPCDDCWCFVCDDEFFSCENPYDHRNATLTSSHWQAERAKRKLSTYGKTGPFPPDTADASQDKALLQCRHCSWFSRRVTHEFHYASSGDWSNDWCSVCGLVALKETLGKRQSVPPQEKHLKDMYYFGEKEFSFRIHAHDPRLSPKYQKNWEQNDWHYDEADRDEEVFEHRIGKSPHLINFSKMISCSSVENIPKVVSESSESRISPDDTDAIIIDDPEIVNFLQVLGQWPHECCVVSASWDKTLRSGSLKVQLFLSNGFFLGNTRESTFTEKQEIIPAILAIWFGVRFDASTLSRGLNPSFDHEMEVISFVSKHALPFGAEEKDQYVTPKSVFPAVRQLLESEAEKFEEAKAKYESTLSLSPSGRNGGGVSSTENSFESLLRSFFQEKFPYIISKRRCDTQQLLAGICKGQTRRVYPRYQFSAFDDSSVLDALVGFKDAVCAQELLGDDARNHTLGQIGFTTRGIMSSLENLGHASELFVEGLNVELLDFQKQALKWALEREQISGGIQSFYWGMLPKREQRQDDLYFSPILSQFRKDKPAIARGGILAAEMGLGKTIISLSLILKNAAPVLPASGSPIASLQVASGAPASGEGWDKSLYGKTCKENAKRGSIVSRGTLVICPVSLVGQWIEEAKSRLKNPGLVYPYHGQSRKRDANQLAMAEIVVTTYQVLASDATYHKQKGGEGYCAPLEQIRWWRIIADEGHSLREGNTQRNHAVQSLVADNKWIVTGTPMSTDPLQMKNLFKFIGIEESEKMFSLISRGRSSSRGGRWKNYESYDASLLMSLLRPIVLRYSQNQSYRGTGTTLMSLPPMKKRTIEVDFSSAEKSEFKKLEQTAQDFYLNFRRGHLKDMSSHFLKVSAKLLPLRVASAGGKYPVSESSSVPENQDDEDEVDEERSKLRTRTPVKYSDFIFSSKAEVLISELKKIRDNEPDSKSLVFSHFASTLEYLQERLPENGFSFRTLKGNMSMKQRAKALHDFQNDPPTTVFLLSMRAGAVGINLTQANRVFLMEPGFNPALEAQAIGRVHRLGQKRNVEICRLVMKNSFESRMVNFLKKKYKLKFDEDSSEGMETSSEESDDVDLGDDPQNDSAKKGALDAEQVLVGNLQNERAQVVTEEFDELFGVQEMVGKYEQGSRFDMEQDCAWDTDDFSPDDAVSGFI